MGTGASPPTVFGCESSKLLLRFFSASLWVSSPLTPVQVALPAWKQVSILIQHQQWIYPPGRRRDVSGTAASRMH